MPPATSPLFRRWVRLTNLYAVLCQRAMHRPTSSLRRMRRVALALALLDNTSGR